MTLKPFDPVVITYNNQTRRFGTFMYWVEKDVWAQVQYHGGIRVLVNASAVEHENDWKARVLNENAGPTREHGYTDREAAELALRQFVQ